MPFFPFLKAVGPEKLHGHGTPTKTWENSGVQMHREGNGVDSQGDSEQLMTIKDPRTDKYGERHHTVKNYLKRLSGLFQLGILKCILT